MNIWTLKGWDLNFLNEVFNHLVEFACLSKPQGQGGGELVNLFFILNVRLVVGGDLKIVKVQKHEHLSCQKFDKYERLDCKSFESNFFTEVFNHLLVQVNFYVFRIPRVGVGVELAIKDQKHQHQDYKSSEIVMMLDWVNECDTSVETHLPTKE